MNSGRHGQRTASSRVSMKAWVEAKGKQNRGSLRKYNSEVKQVGKINF